MYNFFQLNKDFMQMTPEQLEIFESDTWCGPSEINEETHWSSPELRIFDEDGGCMSVDFHELEEIDDLIGRLYVLRKIFTDDFVLDTEREEPGFYPKNAKLRLL